MYYLAFCQSLLNEYMNMNELEDLRYDRRPTPEWAAPALRLK